ncbi:hypothetical protein AAIA72_10965 [Hahella sp. SMD15-11]|uniref:DUF2946 domain-containing protein n=1 Tax=Thermohahella caldifontis TaxID=3142973 RepID=A0AB39UTD5_9GAMM
MKELSFVMGMVILLGMAVQEGGLAEVGSAGWGVTLCTTGHTHGHDALAYEVPARDTDSLHCHQLQLSAIAARWAAPHPFRVSVYGWQTAAKPAPGNSRVPEPPPKRV